MLNFGDLAHLLMSQQSFDTPADSVTSVRGLVVSRSYCSESRNKTPLPLDEIGKVLDPEFDPNAAVRRHAATLMSTRMKQEATEGNLLTAAMEFKNFATRLPHRVNRIMDAVANKEIELKVRAVDAGDVIEGMQKIANRVTTGLILAALIIGAALLMRVETDFRVLGYPGSRSCALSARRWGAWCCW